MDNIYIMIDITNDPLYVKGWQVGYDEGYQKGMLSNVNSMILSTKFDNNND